MAVVVASPIPGAVAVAPSRADSRHLALQALATAGPEEDALTAKAGVALATREDPGLSSGDTWINYRIIFTCGY